MGVGDGQEWLETSPLQRTFLCGSDFAIIKYYANSKVKFNKAIPEYPKPNGNKCTQWSVIVMQNDAEKIIISGNSVCLVYVHSEEYYKRNQSRTEILNFLQSF